MKTLIFLAMSLAITSLKAQQDSTENKWSFTESKKIIKITPFDILNKVPMIGADMEFTYTDEINLQVGMAIVPSYLQTSVGSEQGDFKRLSGYNLRGESRFYILKKPNRYLAAGFNFRHLVIKSNVPVGMESSTNNPQQQQDFAYFVNTPMRFHRFNSNINVKWGFQKPMGKNFVFDFYLGLALNRIGVQSFSKIPEGGVVTNDWSNMFTLKDNYKTSNIRPIIGFKIGYKL